MEPPAPLPPTSRSPGRVSIVMRLIPVPLQLLFLALCTLAAFLVRNKVHLVQVPLHPTHTNPFLCSSTWTVTLIYRTAAFGLGPNLNIGLGLKSLNLNIGLGLNLNILDFYSTWIFCNLDKLTNTHKHCSLVFSQTQVNIHTHTSSTAYLLQYYWHMSEGWKKICQTANDNRQLFLNIHHSHELFIGMKIGINLCFRCRRS